MVTEKVEVDIHTEELDNRIGAQLADKLRGELELIDGVYPEFDKEEYLKGELAPVFFGSALNNFGVQELLDCFVEIAPSPRPVKAEEREVEPEEPKFYRIHLQDNRQHRPESPFMYRFLQNLLREVCTQCPVLARTSWQDDAFLVTYAVHGAAQDDCR